MDSKPGQIHRQTPGNILVAGSTSFHRRWIRSLGKTLLESLVRKRRRRYIQDSVRCRRATDCSPAQSLPHSTHPPQSRKAKKFQGFWDGINCWIPGKVPERWWRQAGEPKVWPGIKSVGWKERDEKCEMTSGGFQRVLKVCGTNQGLCLNSI